MSLRSIEIFKTHEWLKATTTVYFLCKGENMTVLLDVKRPHAIYAFNGQESWQVLYTVFVLLFDFPLTISCLNSLFYYFCLFYVHREFIRSKSSDHMSPLHS